MPGPSEVEHTGPGSRAEPHALGTTLVLEGRADITIESVDLDADDEWVAFHDANDPPPAGMRFIFARAAVTNTSQSPAFPAQFNVWAVGSGDQVHDERCRGVVPDAMPGVSHGPGETSMGNFCLLVPVNEIEDGSLLLRISPLLYPEDARYVRLTAGSAS